VLSADADCDNENKPIVNATNTNLGSVLIFSFIVFLLIFSLFGFYFLDR